MEQIWGDVLAKKKYQVSDVFGIGVQSGTPAYVDRGELDLIFKRHLASNRHVSIHGGSKQGKTWLRKRGLAAEESLVVQCTTTSKASTLLEEALAQLGVTIKLTQSGKENLSGSVTGSLDTEAGSSFLAKIKASLTASATASEEQQIFEQFIGQSVANLKWVANAIRLSKKRLVIEDFHYLIEREQEVFASWMKALGEYGVHVIIVGVWARSHLLTYFNGDLEGRVEDIHLLWSNDELKEVIENGAEALDITFTAELIDSLIEDSYGNVGVVHRLAEKLCYEAKVDQATGPLLIDVGPELDAARLAVADQMRSRFEKFASNFVRGMRRMPQGLVVYLHLLKAFTRADDKILLAHGLDTKDLLTQINGDQQIRPGDLSQALVRVDRLQDKIKVSPPVLAYESASRRVQLLDRSFLFFRKYGDPVWPWDEVGYEITNDLASSSPLNLDNDDEVA